MKKKFTSSASLVLLLSAFLSSCGFIELDDFLNESPKPLPEEISFTRENLFPEGVEYDKTMDKYLVSSLVYGTIGIVDDNGNYTEWINDEDIPSTIGIHIDQPRKRLLVAVADPGASVKSSPATVNSLAGLAAYDLKTGKRLFYTRLDNLLPNMPHFGNDVTVDNKGNAYVTDSFTGAIYKVDPMGNASLFFRSEAFDTGAGVFGLNGIDYDPRGYLLVAKSNEGKLLRFPIDKPEAYTEVNVPVNLPSPDGLYIKNNKELVVVNNANGGENAKVVTLSSNDGWKTSSVVDTFETGAVFPTTATERMGEVYVLYAHLNELFSGGSRREFKIVRAE